MHPNEEIVSTSKGVLLHTL